MAGNNPYAHLKKPLAGFEGKSYFDLRGLGDGRVDKLPYSIRILLESALRNCDDFEADFLLARGASAGRFVQEAVGI